jgi:hypothetical protein
LQGTRNSEELKTLQIFGSVTITKEKETFTIYSTVDMQTYWYISDQYVPNGYYATTANVIVSIPSLLYPFFFLHPSSSSNKSREL